MRLSVIGPPGSGKSTQAKMLVQKLKLPHVYVGGLLREEVKRGTELGKKVRSSMDEGGLVGDDLVLALFFNRVEQEDCRSGFIADATPRTIYQAEKIEERIPFDKVLFVRVSLSAAKQRLLDRERKDDTEEAISRRFRVYEEATRPIVEFYRARGKLVEVDGEGSVEDVTMEILKKLGVGGAKHGD